MRNAFQIVFVLVVSAAVLATEQVPDILYYDDLALYLSTGWGHPSPLETYYHQSRLALPFEAFSTANYRGHVAVWEIVNGTLHLTDIQIEDIEPNEANSYGYDLVVCSYEPNEYGVRAGCCPTAENGDVVADWFSGILDCYLVQDGRFHSSYLFHVQDGNVIDTEIITTQDYDMLYHFPPSAWNETLKRKYRMLVLNENYVTYYYRLNEDDAFEFEGQECRLEMDFTRLSPIFGLYDNDHLRWPYNWENAEKCGAPHCRWLLEDDKLYLMGVELYSGLSFYTVDTETLDLATLLEDRVINGVVSADWVSGVYLIKHGSAMEQDAGWPGYTLAVFRVTELTYIRMENGRSTESYTVPVDFDMESASEGLKQIIEDYQLPVVPGLPLLWETEELDTPPTHYLCGLDGQRSGG